MISIKKITTVAAAAVLSFGLFAQANPKPEPRTPVSKTKESTAGLFSNDVDDFTDVNYWSNVAPKQFFAYFGMGSSKNVGNTYNIGFAKQLKKFYWGTYFSGNFGLNKTTKPTDGDKTTETTLSEFQFNNTYGFGNVGLAFNLYYLDNGSQNTIKHEYIDVALKAGLKEYAIKKTKIIPYAEINFLIGGLKEDVTTGGSTITVDSRDWDLKLAVGADIPYGKVKNVEQTFNVGLEMDLNKPVDSDLKYSNFTITIPLGYKAILKATNALSFGFSADLKSDVKFGKAGDASTFGFGLTPSIAAGVTYATKKNIDLNAGVSFDVPSFTYSKNDNESIAEWNGDDAELHFNSGFAIKPTKNICIDCSYEILADLFGNNTTVNFNTNQNFWTTVNQILIHKFGFEVSVKF